MSQRNTRTLGWLCVTGLLVLLLFGGTATTTAVAQSDGDETSSEGEIIYEEKFDYSTFESSPWECYNRPYGHAGTASKTSKKGFCDINGSTAKVQEESNRRRYLSRIISLPETDGNITVEARAKGRVSNSWSQSRLVVVGDSSVRFPPHTNDGSDTIPWRLMHMMDVISSKGRDPGVTVTDWKTVTANITERAGDEVRLVMYANGRRTFDREETTSWVEVDYIRIEKEINKTTIKVVDDGDVHQTGKVTEVVGTVEEGGNISVTGEIQAETPEASDNIVYSTVGLSDGTILDVEQMDGLGSGNVTHSLKIPERPDRDVVWSFHSAVTEEGAVEGFKSYAQSDFVDDQGRNLGIVIAEGEEYVSRISDGELYQTGRVTELEGTVEAGGNISVVAEIIAEAPEASDDIVYGSVGLSDGTVLDVERMDGSGNGTVTHTLRIPETAQGDVVWSYQSTTTEEKAIEEFKRDAQDGFVDERGRDLGLVVGTVSAEDEEGLPGFTAITALLALASVAAVLLRRRE